MVFPVSFDVALLETKIAAFDKNDLLRFRDILRACRGNVNIIIRVATVMGQLRNHRGPVFIKFDKLWRMEFVEIENVYYRISVFLDGS